MLAPLCLSALALYWLATAAPPEEPNHIQNPSFGQNLAHWISEGDIKTVKRSDGQPAVHIGPAAGAIRQRYEIGGLRIVLFGATLHVSDPKGAARVRVQCFDAKQHLVMEQAQSADPAKAILAKGESFSVYFKTQAKTAYLIVSIEKDADAPGSVMVTEPILHDYDRNRKAHAARCDLDAYMRPIWQGDTVTNETVLLLSSDGAAGRGKLLYPPTEILRVQDSTLTKTFVRDKDYHVEDSEIVEEPGSEIPTVRDQEFPKGNYPWLNLAGRHIVVTYRHSGAWKGPIPSYEGDRLPHTLAKLTSHAPLTVVALGDSITLGINVSGYRNEAPYMPTWADLFATRLGKIYGSPVKMYNAGLGGMTAQWGRDQAESAVADLNPDLVLIAFGMNDFWSVDPADFRRSIEQTMARIRAKCPQTEFILISSIKFDPAYTQETAYVEHLDGYAKALRELVGEGVRLLDMTAISEALYRAKSAKDLMTDPMHPDDFLARWYAQGLVAMLDRRPTPAMGHH